MSLVSSADFEVYFLLYTVRYGPRGDAKGHSGLVAFEDAPLVGEHPSGCGHNPPTAFAIHHTPIPVLIKKQCVIINDVFVRLWAMITKQKIRIKT